VETQQVPAVTYQAVVYQAVVIGAGFGGLCAGIKLREAGVTDFVILEKADDVGGTWRENTYPGAGCDVMSLMYSLSFAQGRWTRMYAKQAERLDYLKRTAQTRRLREHLRFGREVISSVFDEQTDTWTLRTRNDETYCARVVIAAPGPLHVPSIPDLPGRDDFRGVSFHSAQWDQDFDPAGKRIAVIGTGASAAQFIPQLAKTAASLSVFQRTPHWVIPKLDRPITDAEHWLFRYVPGVQKAYRYGIYWSHEAAILGFMHPRFMPALQRPNVELVTAGIERITESGIRTADGDYPVDAIVYGTGFAISDRMAHQRLVGRGGLSIQQAWRDGMEAYLGVAVHGFPNYFLIVGPNSGGGHQSNVFVIEAQMRYIIECLKLMNRTGSTRIEVRRSSQQRFNERIHAKLAGTVWNSGGCHSWYLDASGRNRPAWRGSSVSYWRRMRRSVPSAFDLSSRGGLDEHVYDGPAALTVAGERHAVRVRLTGHVDPIDGRYHWQGTVFDAPAGVKSGVLLGVDGRTARARITEQTPWGSYSIAGVGAPPYLQYT
jgi:cation diffusion facilitator CzcD-associated flavoprotein CzcO